MQNFGQYKLSVYFKDGSKFHQDINLVKVVKITDPEVYNATYSSEEVLIFIKYQHEYVTDPLFQLEIWSDGVGKKTVWNYTRKRMTIPKNWLTGGKTNHVHVRAKPVEYFDGSWTHWSPKKSFLVEGSKEESLVTYIIFCTCLALVVCFLTLVLRWKKEIKAYISPSIPNPKEALAQIHREKEHPPVSFSPEMFNDVSINRVDFAEQKLIPELDEGQEDSTGSCQTESVGSLPASVFDKQNGNDRQLEEEISHLKIRLLDQPEDGKNENASHRLATLQSHKDETYVTMSSLYKTQ
ncbi:interleukin-7 receptor subunit alpha isoform X2 [Hoplias malabaricus]|uniref:interleukin-7 receptor subunit alpha isoform X2 n=1 Tax=Hoplias malabaricus TaxID=27720 RepID=UPI0034622E9B